MMVVFCVYTSTGRWGVIIDVVGKARVDALEDYADLALLK